MLDKLETHPRPALALLARCCRREQANTFTAASWASIAEQLRSEDGKTRKNAAVLLGQLGVRDAVPMLVQALQAEQQLFVRPSMILALGAIGGSDARECVQALPVPDGTEKHARQEADAIAKALSRLAPVRSRVFTGLPESMLVMLSPVTGLYDSLQHEAAALGYDMRRQSGLGCVKTADYASLYKMRCFHQAMLPVAQGIEYTPQAVAKACAGGLFGRLCAMHGGSREPFPARVELRKPPQGVDRAGFASDVFRMLKGFTNAPSGYDIELRVAAKADGKADLFCLLHTFADERFAYRLGSVPASINPAAAAAALRLGMRRQKLNARVLDPFCGSGTMLIERSMLSECSALHGVDISKQACGIARRNAQAAGVEMPVYNRDIIGFKADEPYDEIICNMPFGNRVGNHRANERLYAGFFAQLPALLKPEGYALCITTEKALVRKTAANMKVAAEVSFGYGGLNPSAFVLVRG